MTSTWGTLLLLVACMHGAHADEPPLPADVQRYLRAAGQCRHFAGEWDSALKKSDRRRIEKNIDRYCGSAQRQLNTLTAKYKHRQSVRTILSEHQYDSVTAYRR